MTRLGARVVLDAEGEPLRRGIEAEPWLVSPNQHEAEQLVGQELDDDDDFLMALDRIAEMGARNVHITMETGCFALVREERQVRRYRARGAAARAGLGPRRRRRAARALARRAGRGASGGGGAAARGRRPARRRCSRSAPAASTRRRRRGSPRSSRSTSCSPSAEQPVRARRGVAGCAGCRPRRRLVESTDSWSSSSIETASSARKASPSTTCCSFRPSRRCSRTTSPRDAADADDRARDPDRLVGDGHRHRGARSRSRSRARAGSGSSTATSRSSTRSPRSTR